MTQPLPTTPLILCANVFALLSSDESCVLPKRMVAPMIPLHYLRSRRDRGLSEGLTESEEGATYLEYESRDPKARVSRAER